MTVPDFTMPPSDALVEGLSGAAAGMTALVLTYPLMTISTKQATRSSGQKEEGQSVKSGASGTLADIADVSQSILNQGSIVRVKSSEQPRQ